jgi:hypothetical protein
VTKLAYISAASHSGSTLLAMLLGSHPQIATVGEMNLSSRAMGDLDHYRCSCGTFIRDCGFWQKVKAAMADRGFEFDLANAGTDYREVNSRYASRLLGVLCRGRAFERLRDIALWLAPAWRNHLSETHHRNAAFASAVSEVTGARVIVDSSKIGLRLKYLLRNPALDVKVIRLIRDGRAVAMTYMDPARFADARDPGLRGGGTGGRRESERLSMSRAAYDWRRCNEEADHVLAQVDSSRRLDVHYEVLCKDRCRILDQVFSFLEVDPGLSAKNFRSVSQHVVGNGMRLDVTSEVTCDERWKGSLSPQDLREFDRVAGTLNRRYGYG